MNWDLTDYHPLLAQRAQSTDTFTTGPAPVGRLPAGDRDPRGARPQLPADPVGRRRQGGRRRAGDVQPIDRAVRGRPRRGDLRAVDGDRRSGGDRTRGHGGRLPLAVLAAERRDPGVVRRQRHRPRHRRPQVRSGGGRRKDGGRRAAGQRRHAVLRRGGAGLQARRARAVPEPAAAGVRRPRRRRGRRRRSCTSPTCRCWRRCWAPTCATAATSRRSTPRRRCKVYAEKPPPSAVPGHRHAEGSDRSAGSLGTAALESDHSLKVRLPARKPLILELVDGSGKALFTMSEEHQLGPGEYVTPGAPRRCSTASAPAATAASAARSWTSPSPPTPSPAPPSPPPARPPPPHLGLAFPRPSPRGGGEPGGGV